MTKEEFIKAMLEHGKWTVVGLRVRCNRDCDNCILLHKLQSCYVIIQEVLEEHPEWLL